MQPTEIVAFVYQISDVFAFLVLAAAGLAIIFGMMESSTWPTASSSPWAAT
jgi:hypothetical protein